jgi:hypothetical protein
MFTGLLPPHHGVKAPGLPLVPGACARPFWRGDTVPNWHFCDGGDVASIEAVAQAARLSSDVLAVVSAIGEPWPQGPEALARPVLLLRGFTLKKPVFGACEVAFVLQQALEGVEVPDALTP